MPKVKSETIDCPFCPAKAKKAKKVRMKHWIGFVNHQRRRYFKDPTDENLLLWANAEDVLEQMQDQLADEVDVKAE